MSELILLLWGVGAAVVAFIGYRLTRRQVAAEISDDDFKNPVQKKYSHDIPDMYSLRAISPNRAASGPRIGAGGTQSIRSGKMHAKQAPVKALAANRASARQPQPKVRKHPPFKLGRLVENIPDAMIVGIPVAVEARITASKDSNFAKDMAGKKKIHDISVGEVMSLKLLGAGRDFDIEARTPETQLVEREEVMKHGLEQVACWRWVITPRKKGDFSLQLSIATKSAGGSGAAGYITYPPQLIAINVKTNVKQTCGQTLKWLGALALGGAISKGYDHLINFFDGL